MVSSNCWPSSKHVFPATQDMIRISPRILTGSPRHSLADYIIFRSCMYKNTCPHMHPPAHPCARSPLCPPNPTCSPACPHAPLPMCSPSHPLNHTHPTTHSPMVGQV